MVTLIGFVISANTTAQPTMFTPCQKPIWKRRTGITTMESRYRCYNLTQMNSFENTNVKTITKTIPSFGKQRQQKRRKPYAFFYAVITLYFVIEDKFCCSCSNISSATLSIADIMPKLMLQVL